VCGSTDHDDDDGGAARRVPLMLGSGTGAELRQPLGYSMVVGLILSQALTLYTTARGLPIFWSGSTLVAGSVTLPKARRGQHIGAATRAASGQLSLGSKRNRNVSFADLAPIGPAEMYSQPSVPTNLLQCNPAVFERPDVRRQHETLSDLRWQSARSSAGCCCSFATTVASGYWTETNWSEVENFFVPSPRRCSTAIC